MLHIAPVDHLSDRELLDATERAATDERQLTAELLALLGEVDARRLYLDQSCASLFSYCTQALHFSEHAARTTRPCSTPHVTRASVRSST
jgi:hypothetical protein